jgi:hypothetical protein
VSGPAADAATPARRPRDPRLDFFRGLAMIVIVISHVPANAWARYIPGRFGFSDAAEIFVFCSGMASALAFGATYVRRGWWLGTVRIAYRIWQVYWVHIGSFLVIAAVMVALTAWDFLLRDYVAQLNLTPFFRDPAENLVGLLTLTYVPNYFDILPMYLVILALVPVVMALAGLHRGLAALFVAVLWLGANLGTIALPAEPWSERTWFFNPFGWQLVFFIGFALGAGWLRPPPVRPELVGLAAAFLLLSLPLAHAGMRNAIPGLAALHEALGPLVGKSTQGPLRVLHFLALAYLAWVAVGPAGARLAEGTLWPQVVAVIRRIGQQSLAVFAVGLLLSRLMGAALDALGRGPLSVAAVNLAGIGLVVATAYAVSWIKSDPAGRRAAPARVAAPATVPGRHAPIPPREGALTSQS